MSDLNLDLGFVGQLMVDNDILIDITCQNDMISNFTSHDDTLMEFDFLIEIFD